ncbi:MAG: pyruvate, water dikinase regulatory protein [Woeseiaceae bacterium]|nr:pyruvate, water dikinase regulatory protein [Woeseiaceae bacterium]
MSDRTVFFLSDQSGVTAETLGHSLLTQFKGEDFNKITLPFIDSEDKAEQVVSRINHAGEKSGARPIVFSTIVRSSIRSIIRGSDGLHLDIFDAFVEPLEKELKLTSSPKPGKAHRMRDIEAYMNRIEATNFAMANDDGGRIRNYDRADVILLGVSRSGKTPTCLYLALHYGIYAANFPLTDDELESGNLPPVILEQRHKLFGLTIAPERLREIRKERRSVGKYASSQQVRYELREAKRIFDRYKIPSVDTTKFSIEEIASRILDHTGVERRVRN